MAITTMDGLIAALAGGQKLDFFKASQTAEAAGAWHSLWKAAGNPTAGSTPGALIGGIPNKATVGAFPFNNPVSGYSYILQAIASGATAGKIILYDRLWHNSEMSGTQIVADTTLGSTVAVDRPDGNGAGVEAWVEIYTAMGAAASGATLNIRYTDQDGNDNQVGTCVHPTNNAQAVGCMLPITLAAGDTGVRKVTAYHWSASTGGAGNFGITLLRRIAEIPISLINTGMLLDALALGLPRVYDDACLAIMVQCSTTNTGIIQGSFRMGQG